MIQFRKNSHAVKILLCISMCGELSWNSLRLIEGNHTRILYTVNLLKKEGYISILKYENIKTIRLKRKSFEIIENISPLILQHYLNISNNHHFRAGKNIGFRQIQRHHLIGEVMCVFTRLNIPIYDFMKPHLSLNSSDINIYNNDIYFYTNTEIKNIDKEQKHKIEFTKIIGLLFSPGGDYAIYNTNKKLMLWCTQGEHKSQLLIEDIVNHNKEEYITNKEKYYQATEAIIFGYDMDICLDVLKVHENRMKKSVVFEYLTFDNVYKNIYFVPTDENGLNQLLILTQKNWKNILLYKTFNKKFITNVTSAVDCDASTDSSYALMFFDGNIGRLRRFALAMENKTNKKFEILCFDWQVPFIKKFCGNKVIIKSFSTNTILNLFNE